MGHGGRYRAAPAEVGAALGALGPSGPSAAKFVPSARSSATSMASLRHPAILRRESAVGRPELLPKRLVFRRGVWELSRGRLDARPANVKARIRSAARGRRAVPPSMGLQSRHTAPVLPRRPSLVAPPTSAPFPSRPVPRRSGGRRATPAAMVDDPVEDDDDKLLELLRECSEPGGVPTQEKADLDRAMRDQCGEAWEQAADQEDQMDARLMLLNEAEKLLRKKLRDGLDALLSAAQDQEEEASLPPPPPTAASTLTTTPPPPHHPAASIH